MKEYAAGIQSSELRLIDEAPAKARAKSDAPDAAPSSAAGANSGTLEPRNGSAQPSAAIAPYNRAAPAESTPVSRDAKVADEPDMPAIDKRLSAATKEFEAGIVDQPLWKHAVAQSGGDRSLATRNYLRARATALRVAKREKRQERRERRARALSGLGTEGAQAPTTPAYANTAPPRRSAPPKRIHVLAIGSTLAVLFVIAFFLVLRSESDASQRNESVAKAAVPATAGAKPVRPAVAAPRADVLRGDATREDWVGKLEKLKSEGNWNVVVLYANEWTRAQPDNVLAWNELAASYVKLRQYRDALDAANKAVQLAPEDATAWARLGQINTSLRQPADALTAFEQAVARDDHDTASIVQVGTLATQLGRLADARAAFAKALALNPVDVDALCGSAALAQKEQRPKDAEAFTRQAAAQDGRCRDPAEGESVRVAVGGKVPTVSPR